MAVAHSTLGDALQAWHARVSPADVGIPSGTKRRVPGLRREELAALAGLSVDYLVRLEQGRATNPSPETLGALARALRLTTPERDCSIGSPGPLRQPREPFPATSPPECRGWSTVSPTPQPRSSRPSTPSSSGTNCGRHSSVTRRSGKGWIATSSGATTQAAAHGSVHSGDELEAHERELVADLRLASIKYPDDRELTTLIESLRAKSTAFDCLWNRFEAKPPSSARKTIAHPTLGEITLDCEVLTITGSDLRIIVFTAAP